MKNLKKLSRNELKSVSGAKLYPGNTAGGNCADTCTPTGGGTDDGCRQYGLVCGFFQCNGQLVNRCMPFGG
ncbi:hypothetical protein QFZ37_002828 [Chryseobacterium ginsenosidimutans]|jgi:hypothetical protein|uniref:bacteriocin-like protein n=1 Tax=Chryseobacterium ginsenosidimutans TaxID=687846 RepID=UPI00278A57BC|nr:hypothetical protein [Chryseobacterium ginsenosidimutans]MDQ0594459.1 hypothetical protein [Chryseobacterium ginsenosidimutans]